MIKDLFIKNTDLSLNGTFYLSICILFLLYYGFDLFGVFFYKNN